MQKLITISAAICALLPQSIAQTAPDLPKPSAPLEADSRYQANREAAKHAKWTVRVDVQMISMEQERALALLPDLESGDEKKLDAGWAKLQAMIASKEATLVAWPMVALMDGGRSVAETIVEKKYPTEFDPPLEPQNAGAPPVSDKPIVESAVPLAFEVRNTGVTIEIQASVLDDGKRINLDIVPQRVELLQMETSESVKSRNNVIVQVRQPLFATIKTNVSLTMRNGAHELIGVHKLTKPENHIELHIVHATATRNE
jgi:hypothetical protein